MKKQILTFILSAVTLTASAITWQEPVPVSGVYLGPNSTIYLYHTGRGQFLTMGDGYSGFENGYIWKRQAILDSTDVAAAALTFYQYDVVVALGFENNSFYLINSGEEALFITQNTSWWESYSSGRYWHYADGQVRVGNDYMIDTDVLGWIPDAEDTDWDGNPTGTNQRLHMVDSKSQTAETQWLTISEDNYQLYLSQKRLYRAAEAAEAAGVDYTAFTEIYEYGRKDQLDAASEELEAASNTQAILENRINTATLDNPQDVTALMVNPDFTTGNTNGWVLNMPNAAELGYQDNTDYTHGEANLTGFIQAWHPNNALENGSITTTINLLPAGRYRLEADVVATCQTKPATDDTSGCQLFVSGFALDQGTDVATANNSPQRFAVDFTLRGGALTLGLRARNTDSNWLASDNFRLTYYGKSEFPEGDLNEDGEVNVADITKVVNIALKKNNQE